MRQLLIGIVMAACAAAISATPIGTVGTNYDPINLINVSGITVTGSLSSASAMDAFTFEVTSAGAVTIQSWGYGGTALINGVPVAEAFGTGEDEDLAGNVVVAGGFQPALSLYDSSNNLLADSDDVPPLFAPLNGNPGACPPAALDAFFYCGDPQLSLSPLAVGAYTLDIAAEQQSFDLDGTQFPTATGTPDYTVDIEGAVALPPAPSQTTTPEPATWALMGAGMLLLFFYWRRRPAVDNDALRW